MENLEDELRRARLRWFGHVRRREEAHILRRAVELVMARKRPKFGKTKEDLEAGSGGGPETFEYHGRYGI